MDEIYSKAKTAGYNAQDEVSNIGHKAKAKIQEELGRMLTEEEEDEFWEGFFNGLY